MSKNLIKALENQEPLNTSKGNFVAFFVPTETRFWCSESGNDMNCSRQWVQTWELFHIVRDEYSGATMIQSNQTKKYAVLQPNGRIRCIENRSVLETHFKIDEEKGNFQACNGNFITNEKNGGALIANSAIPVEYQIFDVKTVAISDPDTASYAYPTTKNGRNVIAMGAKQPYTFYLLYNRMTEETYLETGSFEFFHPDNTTLPVTYAETPIDVNNYRLKVEETDKAGVYTILAEATGRYFSRESTSEYGDAIYANSATAEGLLQKFKITPTR